MLAQNDDKQALAWMENFYPRKQPMPRDSDRWDYVELGGHYPELIQRILIQF